MRRLGELHEPTEPRWDDGGVIVMTKVMHNVSPQVRFMFLDCRTSSIIISSPYLLAMLLYSRLNNYSTATVGNSKRR